MRKFLLPLFVAFCAAGANASTVTASAGSSFTINFNGIVDVNNVATVMPGLTASADFDFKSWTFNSSTNKTTVVFDITISNTSNAGIWQSAIVSGIGFDTDPNALSGSATGVFAQFAANKKFPTGAGFFVENCFRGGSNGAVCGGTQPPSSLNVGGKDKLTVTMTFAGNVQSLDFSNFGIRWQALDSSRLGLRGASGIGVETSTPPVPEPASMAVFGLGALIVGAALRKRNRA